MEVRTTTERTADREVGPVVSVIVPNYNHAAFLKERIASIAAQTMRDMEVILLDDASTDGSTALLERMAASLPGKVQLVVNAENSGSPFKQWLKGIAMAPVAKGFCGDRIPLGHTILVRR